MKLNRRDLRRLIESVINEEANPGSKFAAAKDKRSAGNKAKNIQELTKAAQDLYDWFVDEVFPGMEKDQETFKMKKAYLMPCTNFKKMDMTVDRFSIPYFVPGSSFGVQISQDEYEIAGGVSDDYRDKPLVDDYEGEVIDDGNKITGINLGNVYDCLEKLVIDLGLSVTMQSDPNEFVAKAGKDNGQVNESLSRGSLYRRRYHGRY